MYFTNHAENEILRIFKGKTVNAPTDLCVGAYLSNPGELGNGTEISYTGYQRQTPVFSTPAIEGNNAYTENVNDIAFLSSPTAPGTITHAGLSDSISGGNMWAYMLLDEPIVVSSGIGPVIHKEDWKYIASGDFTKSYKVKLLNLFRGINLSGFNPYVALYNGHPDEGGSELSGAGYARFSISFSNPAEQASGQMMIHNDIVATSGYSQESWGEWTHTVIFDAESSGEAVVVGERDVSFQVGKGFSVTIPIGAFSISLT